MNASIAIAVPHAYEVAGMTTTLSAMYPHQLRTDRFAVWFFPLENAAIPRRFPTDVSWFSFGSTVQKSRIDRQSLSIYRLQSASSAAVPHNTYVFIIRVCKYIIYIVFCFYESINSSFKSLNFKFIYILYVIFEVLTNGLIHK